LKLPSPLQEAFFLSRPNRFTCLVRIPYQDAPVRAHLPDPGRLRELLQPGVQVWLEPRAGAQRKTAFQVWLVEKDKTLVSLHTGLPNLLVQEALKLGTLQELAQYPAWKRERQAGSSRLDFFLEGSEPPCWLEVKSVTLVEGDCGLFPDAPTTRGRKHVDELARLRRAGERAAVLFVVQRADALRVRANRRTDPDFAAALLRAQECGVELLAYSCEITLTSASLVRPIPVTVD
jgi:sugar fermentation stimulation protein A